MDCDPKVLARLEAKGLIQAETLLMKSEEEAEVLKEAEDTARRDNFKSLCGKTIQDFVEVRHGEVLFTFTDGSKLELDYDIHGTYWNYEGRNW